MIWLLIQSLIRAETPSEPHTHPFTRPVSTEHPLGVHPGPVLCQEPDIQNKAAPGPAVLALPGAESALEDHLDPPLTAVMRRLRPREGKDLIQVTGEVKAPVSGAFPVLWNCWPEFSWPQFLHP